MKSYKVYLICFLAIGTILAIALAAYFLKDSIQLSIEGKQATGVIISVNYFEHVGIKGQQGFDCTYSFAASDLLVYEEHNRFHGLKQLYSVGDSVGVIYLPHNPSISRINSFNERYLLELIVLILMTIFSVVLFILFGGRKKGLTKKLMNNGN